MRPPTDLATASGGYQVPADWLVEAMGDLSHAELARRLGITTKTVGRWRAGGLAWDRWLSVTVALGLPADWRPLATKKRGKR